MVVRHLSRMPQRWWVRCEAVIRRLRVRFLAEARRVENKSKLGTRGAILSRVYI